MCFGSSIPRPRRSAIAPYKKSARTHEIESRTEMKHLISMRPAADGGGQTSRTASPHAGSAWSSWDSILFFKYSHYISARKWCIDLNFLILIVFYNKYFFSSKLFIYNFSTVKKIKFCKATLMIKKRVVHRCSLYNAIYLNLWGIWK
jgi:hypothetical protein